MRGSILIAAVLCTALFLQGCSSGCVDDAYARRPRSRRYSNVAATGTPPWSTLSIDLDGVDQFVERADEEALSCDTEDEFTACQWIKIDTLATNKTIAAKWGFQTQGEWSLATLGTNGALTLFIANALNDNGANQAKAPDGTISAGTWYFVCAWFDGSGIGDAGKGKIYVDNVQSVTAFNGTLPATLQNGTASFKYGQWGGTLDRPWGPGNLDEPCFWCSALSEADLTIAYNGGESFDCASIGSPIVALRMGENDTHPTATNRGSAGNFTYTNTVEGDFVGDFPP